MELFREARLRISEMNKQAGRCWKGYEPTPGKEPYSDGSCQPKGGKKPSKDKDDKKKKAMSYTKKANIGKILSNIAGSTGRVAAAPFKGLHNLGKEMQGVVNPVDATGVAGYLATTLGIPASAVMALMEVQNGEAPQVPSLLSSLRDKPKS